MTWGHARGWRGSWPLGAVPSLPGAPVCGRPSCLHALPPPALLLPSLDHVSPRLQGQRDRRGPSPGSAEAPERAGLARAQLRLPGEVPVCARLPRQGLTHPVWKSCCLPHFPDRKVRHGVVSEQSDSSSCLTKCSHLQPTLFFFLHPTLILCWGAKRLPLTFSVVGPGTENLDRSPPTQVL